MSQGAPRYAFDRRPTDERARLLGRVPANSTVLDVGAWDGLNGRELMRRGCVVDGVEPVAAAAERAARDYRQVWTAPIESLDAQVAPGAYDAVLFMDVLEHLADPLTALRRAARWLAPGGRVVISIPNVAYWTIRVRLALGDFTYRREGVLDATHLRFFTRASLLRLVAHAGFRVDGRLAGVGPHPLLARLRPSVFAVQMMGVLIPARESAEMTSPPTPGR